ncbi:MAG: hypothetical protein ACJ788_04830 [Ktedonobacteraceae bacterium]
MVLELAKLTVMKGGQPQSDPPPVTVQFNPQSLSVNYRSSGAVGTENASTGTNKMGNKAQPTGFSSGLSTELLFDTSQTGDDVRKQTLAIAVMLQMPNKSSAPTVQFSWGTFVFTGILQSMDETLDLFSERGVPLRATVRLSMSGTDLEQQKPDTGGGGGGAGIGLSASASFSAGVSVGFSAQASLNAGIAVGTTPLTLAQAGDTLQSLSGRAGISSSWKAVASANGIDNPRQMDPGTVLNLNVGVSANVS